ncbi:methionine ABC transporter ATP-binding protein [Lacicoccus alkaliphilus]|uniref:D-methionine transport system ATP-binding protein n=1 Tax=Lacicoccus alkaliphilus DSM 16010 TaxID=1123231 RepID=A0A1M7BTV8_9BACL|nr:ATP-binding cassette domain-containing protein [Salinicoccus alkaliphilus]SHL58363.1 D-methionine transport system ATP-binding protein [Salinicoccus alkaliphilus DSM 16010]
MSIVFKDVSKTYIHKGKEINALRPTSLTIHEGEIFGLIGFSGAGKSTLLRLINMLESPSSGMIHVGDDEMTGLSNKDLRVKRQKIGMIFQQFNLIESKTVAENIEFVLKAAEYPKGQRDGRIDQLLDLVGLSDKKTVYPKNLSGGQKQRVGIARALANDPDVLLSDEATSALDPDTTKTILNLLKRINKELGITIVVITHEMAVIKELAERVGVMSDGAVIELGDVYQIFSEPKHEVTKGFVQDIYDFEVPAHIVETSENRIITLKFLRESAEENHLNKLYRNYDLSISILNGRVEYINGIPLGILMLQVSGESDEIRRLIESIDKTPGVERAEIYD